MHSELGRGAGGGSGGSRGSGKKEEMVKEAAVRVRRARSQEHHAAQWNLM